MSAKKSPEALSPPLFRFPDGLPYRVHPGEAVDLSRHDPAETQLCPDKQSAEARLDTARKRIQALQTRLYAENRQSLLVVFQAIDTGGKDGAIKAMLQGVNPQGCQVASFKQPSGEELAHDFLWRVHRKAPARGMIGVFNRSHYEDVLIARVKNLVAEPVWRTRYRMINDFEHLLAMSGTVILKFFLHISKDEQKRRLQARLNNPDKHWKFSRGDLAERKHWPLYQAAFEDAIHACSTDAAPWFVIPANKKWYRNMLVAETVAATLAAMNPRFPPAEADLAGLVIPD